MKSLSQFLVENLIPIMELSSATYKSAADKAVIKNNLIEQVNSWVLSLKQ